uniref:Uncharacterized protein n=1 Tax=Arundo donax TaxID=35708 RepID=A0A0A9C5D1_ARUDO
MPRCLFVRY